jgi:hypothetical protein
LLIALCHLALLVLVLALLWWFQTTPAAVQASAQQVLASRPVGTFLFLGGSIASAAALYWRLAVWVHRAASVGWLYRYLTKGLF